MTLFTSFKIDCVHCDRRARVIPDDAQAAWIGALSDDRSLLSDESTMTEEAKLAEVDAISLRECSHVFFWCFGVTTSWTRIAPKAKVRRDGYAPVARDDSVIRSVWSMLKYSHSHGGDEDDCGRAHARPPVDIAWRRR